MRRETDFDRHTTDRKNLTAILEALLLAGIAVLLVMLWSVQPYRGASPEITVTAERVNVRPDPRRRAPARRPEMRMAAEVGSVVTFGHYEQNGSAADGKESLEWIVLQKEGDHVLLISRYILHRMAFDAESGDGDPTWGDSGPFRWLNGTFLRTAFSAEEQRRIDTVSITSDTEEVQSKVFLLSMSEAGYYFKSDAARKAQPIRPISANDSWESDRYYGWDGNREEGTANGRNCWLLRPDGYYSDCAVYVDNDGQICDVYGNGLAEYINGIRPAIWVSVSAFADNSAAPAGWMADGEYYGILKNWNRNSMTIEKLTFNGIYSQSLNYDLRSTGQTVMLDISRAAVYLEYAWFDSDGDVRCASIDDALNTDCSPGVRIREECTMQIRYVVENAAVTRIVILYAA